MAERLRAVAREMERIAGDPEEIRKGREALDARWQSALAAQAARRATLHRTKAGEVLLSHNHVILLHALYDRPGGVASSSADWERAAAPYASAFGHRASEFAIRRATRTISEALVERRRRGRCKEAVLTEAGRGVVERTVPAWVRGHGLYEGLRCQRGRA